MVKELFTRFLSNEMKEEEFGSEGPDPVGTRHGRPDHYTEFIDEFERALMDGDWSRVEELVLENYAAAEYFAEHVLPSGVYAVAYTKLARKLEDILKKIKPQEKPDSTGFGRSGSRSEDSSKLVSSEQNAASSSDRET
jgi:hypothetical protein